MGKWRQTNTDTRTQMHTHTHIRAVEIKKWFRDDQKLGIILEMQNTDGIGPMEVTPVKDTQLGPL